MRVVLAAMVAGLVLFGELSAETHVVYPDGSGDFPSIQAAIDSAAPGDVVLLADGVFRGSGNRDIDYEGKVITVASQSGDPSLCVIDCEGTELDPHRGFHFHSGEGLTSMLADITITGGFAHGDYGGQGGGGAILCESSPTIARCRIVGNESDLIGGGVACRGPGCEALFLDCVVSSNVIDAPVNGYGGGISCYGDATPTFRSCLIEQNSSSYTGGGFYTYYADPGVLDCTIVGNSAGGGGGVTCGSSAFFQSCTVVGNEALVGAGFYFSHSWASVDRTIIAFNTSGAGVGCGGGIPDFALTCCDVYGNEGGDWVGCVAEQYGIDGNISADPLFCGLPEGDYTIESASPCSPFSSPNEECDLVGAWGIGCETSPVKPSTWGEIKALYQVSDEDAAR